MSVSGTAASAAPSTMLPAAIIHVISQFPKLLSGLGIGSSSTQDDPDQQPFRQYICGMTNPYASTGGSRTVFTDAYAAINAWPSIGGVIILDDAEAMDFEFLGLNPLDPPLERYVPAPTASEEEKKLAADGEDAFCRRLLLLGAKWWDSEARYNIVAEMEGRGASGVVNRRVDDVFIVEDETPPTMREKRWIKVGWPSDGRGVWISEFDTTWAGVDEEENLLPYDEETGRLKMVRTMDERCEMLRTRFKAKFYEDLGREYNGYGFFYAWEDKVRKKGKGEVGKLLSPEETADLWSEMRQRNGYR